MSAHLARCREALLNPNVRAILRLIREGESTQDPEAYSWLYGSTRGAPKLFRSFTDHPRVKTYEKYDGQFIKNGKLDYTTAAGAYQIVASTWDGTIQPALKLPDFSPASQDLGAVYLLIFRRALDDVLAGRIPEAMAKLRSEWASMPGAQHGDQPTLAYSRAMAVYAQWGGLLAPAAAAGMTPSSQLDTAPAPEAPEPPPPAVEAPQPAPEPEPAPAPAPTYSIPAGEAGDWQPPEASMPIPAIVGALLPSLIESIPRLGKLFGTGSAVAERNVAAATMALEIAQQAVGARNAQEAVETIKADPAAAQVASKAIESRWLDLTEGGGGGIEGARKADAEARAAGDIRHSPSFWIALLMLPMVYLLILSLIGIIGTATWSDDVRAGLAGSIVSAVIGGLVGYYYGQTTSRNRTGG